MCTFVPQLAFVRILMLLDWYYCYFCIEKTPVLIIGLRKIPTTACDLSARHTRLGRDGGRTAEIAMDQSSNRKHGGAVQTPSWCR